MSLIAQIHSQMSLLSLPLSTPSYPFDMRTMGPRADLDKTMSLPRNRNLTVHHVAISFRSLSYPALLYQTAFNNKNN